MPDGYYENNSARYAFLAFLIAVVVVIILTTCVVNVRRIRGGRAPIVSRYLAPPSYYQSQHEYRSNGLPLPTYTEEANPQQDVGYYDANGNFVTAKPELNVQGPGILNPPQAHTVGGPVNVARDDGVSYAPPAGPPPGTVVSTSADSTSPTSTSNPYIPPPGPPAPPAMVSSSPAAPPYEPPSSSTGTTGTAADTGSYAVPPGPPPTHAKN